MPNKWELVDSWLDDVLDSQRLTLNVTCIPQAFTLSSPPPSIRPGRKREHYARSDPCNGSIVSSPRKRTRTEDDQLTTTAASALDSIQLPSTVPSRSSSPTKIKATSPVRELRSIYRFATPPLKFTTSVDENTPQSVADVICGLPVYGEGVIPGSLKVQSPLHLQTRSSLQIMTNTLRKPSKLPYLLNIFPTSLSMPLRLTTTIRTFGKQLQLYFRERSPVSSTTCPRVHGL